MLLGPGMTIDAIWLACAMLFFIGMGLVITRSWSPELGVLIAGGPLAIRGLAAAQARPESALPAARLLRR